MSVAVTVAIAEAIKDELKRNELSQSYELQRTYADFKLELESAGPLRIDVVNVTTETESTLAARGKLQWMCKTDIAIRKRFDQAARDDATGYLPTREVDPLVFLVQEVVELFCPTILPNCEGTWETTKIVVCPDNTHLRDLRQFTGIVRIEHRIDKAIVRT